MKHVTIHSSNKEWNGAQVVGIGKDSLTGERDVLIVHHPHFAYDLEFYGKPDAQGRRQNVGNAAFWVTEEVR